MICNITGEAVVTVEYDELNRKTLIWERADENIHIARELLNDQSARTLIEAKYELGEYCRYNPDTVHARLRYVPECGL